MIPLYHDLTDETVLVFGGGAVGARKADGFAGEADVVVVSPAFDDALLDDAILDDASPAATPSRSDTAAAEPSPPIRLVRAAPDPEAVRGWIDRVSPALVVAATDDRAVNAAAESAALDAGILVNRTDVSGGRDAGSVVVPATVDDGPVGVAVTTSGTSPAVSRHLRRELESTVEGAGTVATVVADLRAELKERPVEPARRREAVRAVAESDEVWATARESGESEVREAADRVVADALDG